MWWAVDLLASEYGAGPRAILDGVYLDELLYLIPQINKRRAFQWKMDATIATVPYMDKKDRSNFLDSLNQLESFNKPKKFDDTGFAALKLALSQNPRFIVK